MPQTPYTFRNLDSFMGSELLDLQDEAQTDRLFACLEAEDLTPEKLESELRSFLERLDWDEHRPSIAKFVCNILPLEKLVPAIYKDWRPIIKEALHFIICRLPKDQLIDKMTQQIVRPDTPLEIRCIQFIEQMPILQKIGQIIARNQHLEPRFRNQLILLENSIRDANAKEIHSIIRRRLNKRLRTYRVELEELIHSEASVSAVVRFRWYNPNTLQNEEGVFKVQKPGIAKHFERELHILDGLAHHLFAKDKKHLLSNVDLPALLKDAKTHLKKELDVRSEQRNLKAAHRRLSDTKGIRVPKLIDELCTPTITAMTFESGHKVTEAYQSSPWRKTELAVKVVEHLIANPLMGAGEETLFHADPHAGNLLVNEETHELILLDWSLVESLSQNDRKHLLMLLSALFLRDEHLIYQAIEDLSTSSGDMEINSETLFNLIQDYLDELSPFNLPSFKQLLQFLDQVGMAGIRFSSSFVIFRKVLLTLEGVLGDIGGKTPLESILAHYASKYWLQKAWGCNALQLFKQPTALSAMDSLSLIQSAQWFGLRTGMQAMSRIVSQL